MTDHDLDTLLEMSHREEMEAVKCAKAMLAKLSVAELRVLMAHYSRGAAADFRDISKNDLISEIAPEYAMEL